MADLKISQLTGATTPLAGTEVLPIVQGGTTKQVSVANLTAGRNTGMTNAVVSNGIVVQTSGVNRWIIEKGIGDGLFFYRYNDAGGYAGNPVRFNRSNGNVELENNLVPATAGQGINFTANTPAAGMTSRLLNWYEEGTWTPAQGGGLSVVGAFSSTGRYTRIGRQVTISGTVTGATSIAIAAAGVITTNLPFTVVTPGHGSATNAAVNAFSALICTDTNVTSAGAIAATGTITFSATYFV